MIMVKLSKNYDSYEDSYKGCFGKLGSDLQVMLHMAEDYNESIVNEEEEEGSKSSKDVAFVGKEIFMTKDGGEDNKVDADQGWLQLGVGSSERIHFDDQQQIEEPEPSVKPRDRLVELNLLPSSLQQQQYQVRPLGLSTPPPSLLGFPLHQDITSGYRPIIWNNPIASSSSIPTTTTTQMIPIGMGMNYPPPFQYHNMENIVGPSSCSTNTIIIDPPPRLRANVWFMLKASPNQTKEPLLPQIPKSYLRIKDGRMTVRLLMKYLVNKLRLNSESEIEITCRGQQLPPFYTLQYVRDNVWSSANLVTSLNPESSSTTSDHVMILHYSSRSA